MCKGQKKKHKLGLQVLVPKGRSHQGSAGSAEGLGKAGLCLGGALKDSALVLELS